MNQTKTSSVQVGQFTALDRIAEQSKLAIEKAKGDFEAAGATAMAMQALREGISQEVLVTLKGLQNTGLGFRTDNAAGYDNETVRDAFVEATLRGVKPVGNEFNIIQRRCYITKEGYQGKLGRLQGFTDLKEDYGVPRSMENGAIIHCKATWKMNGHPDSQEADIPVKVNAGMGADAILGKAQRKFLKRVFERATGKREPEDDGDVIEVRGAVVTKVETAPNFGNADKGTLNV